MSNDPFPSQHPPQRPTNQNQDLSNSTFIANALMWVAWITAVFGIVVLYLFAYRPNPESDQWATDQMVVAVLLLLAPIALILRFFAINKVKNIWFKFVTYGLGLLVSTWIIAIGYFAVINGAFTLIAAGSIMVLLYFPATVRIAKK